MAVNFTSDLLTFRFYIRRSNIFIMLLLPSHMTSCCQCISLWVSIILFHFLSSSLPPVSLLLKHLRDQTTAGLIERRHSLVHSLQKVRWWLPSSISLCTCRSVCVCVCVCVCLSPCLVYSTVHWYQFHLHIRYSSIRIGTESTSTHCCLSIVCT